MMRNVNKPLSSDREKLNHGKSVAIVFFGLFIYSGIIGNLPIISTLPVDFGVICITISFGYSLVMFARNKKSHMPVFFVLLFIILTLPSIVFNSSIGFDKYLVTIGLVVSMAFIGTRILDDEQSLALFLKTLEVLGFIIALQTITFGVTSSNFRVRLYGANPIWLSRAISFFPYWLVVLLLNGKIGALRFTFAILPALYAMILTGSKGPLLSLAIAIIILILRNIDVSSISKRGILVTYLIVPLLLLGTIFLKSRLPVEIVDQFIGFITGGRQDLARRYLFNRALELTLDNPFGIGPGKFEQYEPIFRYPHNLVLEALVELGWLFGLFLVLMVTYTFLLLFRNAKDNFILQALMGFYTIAVVNSMFSGDITSPKEIYIVIPLVLYYVRKSGVLRSSDDILLVGAI